MSVMIFTLRCSRCQRSSHFTGTLANARTQLCGPCTADTMVKVRFTVVGHEDAPPEHDSEPGATDAPGAVTTAPDIETPVWRITPTQETKARHLLEQAFGKE